MQRRTASHAQHESRHTRRLARVALFVLGVLISPELYAQSTQQEQNGQNGPAVPTVAATADWNADRWRGSRDRLHFTLSRSLDSGREQLGVVIGGVDYSDLVVLRGTHASLTTDLARLPAGEQDAVVYVVRDAVEWNELVRVPLRVRSRAGFEQSAVRPSIELNSVGQLDRRDPPDVEAFDRRRYQDVTVRIAVEGQAERDGWQLSTNGNAIAVTQEQQRVRFAELQGEAPALDLADYRLHATRPGVEFTIGHQAAGTHRFLLNGFGSRGIGGRASLGPAVAIEGALLNGTHIAGWGNPFGVNNPTHRVATAGVTLEMVPSRPGALAVHVAGVEGSLLPLTSFNQGAPADAESSRGGGVSVVASDIEQRFRLQAGYARSQFTNPFDPTLAGTESLVSVQQDTRAARYAELAVDVLRTAPVLGTSASAALIARHERVDPLYRSVASFVASDRDVNGADLLGNVGPLSFQSGASTSRDNLQRLPSILTTRTNNATAGASLPLSALLPGPSWLLPGVSYALQRTHQFGEGVPVNGEFDPSHIPDQVSTNETAMADWNTGAYTLSYRWNASLQDNRQLGRENADFLTVVNALSIGGAARAGLDASLDVSRERQTIYELDITQQLDRIGASVRWQPLARTDVLGIVSQSWGRQPTLDARTRNTELQLELSRGFDLYRRYDGGTQGRFFIRYARTRAALLPLFAQPLLDQRITWTLNAGGSLRIF